MSGLFFNDRPSRTVMRALTAVLLLTFAALNLKHGWDAFGWQSPQQLRQMRDLGLSAPMLPWLGVLSIALGAMLLVARTFVIANVLSAMVIALIMGSSLYAGNIYTAVLEIPFLALHLVLIRLKYPFSTRKERPS